MTSYIQDVLGSDVTEQKFIMPSVFPMYLRNDYSYKTYIINEVKCLVVKPYDFSLVNYRKHRLKIVELSGLPVILELDYITPYQRKSLIKYKIPFVVKDLQLYIPFLAMSLTEKYNKVKKVEKFSPVTQLVFLYNYYNKKCLPISELSKILGYSSMSIHRAYKELTACGLFQCHTEGRKKCFSTVLSDEKLLAAAEQYFINPVIKTIRCTDRAECQRFLKSGLYALSEKTLLGINNNELCYAVAKKQDFDIKSKVSDDEEYYNNVICIEYWSYDPCLLTNNDCVDDISLILSLKDAKDERVQIAVDELRRKYKW